MLRFDLETHSDQQFAEACEAGSYDVNRLQERWEWDLNLDVIVIKKDIIIVLDSSIGYPVMNMLKKNSENYEGDEMTCFDKDGV